MGGKCSASAGVSTEVMISQANGKISTSVAGTSTRCHGLNGSRPLRRGRAACVSMPGAGAWIAVMICNG